MKPLAKVMLLGGLSLSLLGSLFVAPATAVDSPPITVTEAMWAPARVGDPFSATLLASGGKGAITWSLVNSTFPGALTLNATSGLLAGTPTSSGLFFIDVRATDGTSTAARWYMIEVKARPMTFANTYWFAERSSYLSPWRKIRLDLLTAQATLMGGVATASITAYVKPATYSAATRLVAAKQAAVVKTYLQSIGVGDDIVVTIKKEWSAKPVRVVLTTP